MPKETPPAPTPEQLAAENAALKAKVAELEARPASEFTADEQKAIAEKVAAGLLREQAENVIKQQRAADAARAEQAKKEAKA